jgi:chromosomal replication initiator protein
MNYFIAPGISSMSEPERIIFDVAYYFKIPIALLKSKSRKRFKVYPRMVAMYFLRQKTKLPLKAISTLLGRSDHTTARHSINTIKDLCEVDQSVKNDINNLWKSL